MKIRNTFIIFIVSGFWHGANWTFIVWGALNAIYFLPLLLTKKNRQNMEVVAHNSTLPSLKEILNILATFGLTTLAWIFFRAENINHALQYLERIFSFSIFQNPDVLPKEILLLLFIFLLIEWVGRKGEYGIERINRTFSRPFRWVTYTLIVTMIFLFTSSSNVEFIYFQF